MDPNFESLIALMSGGATGLLGAGLSRVSEVILQRDKHAQNVEMAKIQVAAIRTEASSKVQELKALAEYNLTLKHPTEELEPAPPTDTAEFKRLSKGNSKAFIVVDVLRALIRPSLTVMLCLMTFLVWVYTKNPALEEQVVLTILYMATTSTLWWFGTRPSTAPKIHG